MIITVLGWVAVISGAIRMFAPHRATKVGKDVLTRKNFTTVAAAIWLVVGAALCYFGISLRE